MTDLDPVTTIDTRFSADDATAVTWAVAEPALQFDHGHQPHR